MPTRRSARLKQEKHNFLFSSKARFQGTSDLHGTKRCTGGEGENKVVSGWKPRQKTMYFTSELVSYFLGTIFEKLQDQVSATNYKHKLITGIQTLTLSCWTKYATF